MRYLLILNIIWLGLMLMFGEARAESASPVFVNMEIIKEIESNGRPFVVNNKSKAYGLYQLTPIVVQDYKNFSGDYRFYYDLSSIQLQAKIAYWYMDERIPALLRHYKLPDTVDNRIIAYNAGIRAVIRNKRPLETVKYLEKYHKLEKELI